MIPIDPSTGWLVVGHGTRHAAGREEFLTTARLLAERSQQAVEPCFLELANPTIDDGLTRLHERGVQRVVVVPLLLFTAGHAKDDVPSAVADAAAQLAMQVAGQTAALDRHESLMELSRLRFQEAAGNSGDAHLLMVGRGGGDPAAQQAMRGYTTSLAESLGVPGRTAFVALAKPSLPEMLEALAREGQRRVVVQPHLLFQGEVLGTIREEVERARQRHPQIEWITARHLGPHDLLVEAVMGRIHVG